MRLAKDDVADLAPLVRRAASLDVSGLVRLRRTSEQISALVRLPFGVLAARTILVDQRTAVVVEDVAMRCSDLLAWLDGEYADPPEQRDAEWRSGLPPTSGWQRVDTVPEAVVRPLVRVGALALQEAAARESVPGAQPRAEVADALLDSIVLTVTDGAHSVEVTLRSLGAVTRLGFLPHGSSIAIDVAGRWVRIAAAYGSVYAERPGSGLALTRADRGGKMT